MTSLPKAVMRLVETSLSHVGSYAEIELVNYDDGSVLYFQRCQTGAYGLFLRKPQPKPYPPDYPLDGYKEQWRKQVAQTLAWENEHPKTCWIFATPKQLLEHLMQEEK